MPTVAKAAFVLLLILLVVRTSIAQSAETKPDSAKPVTSKPAEQKPATPKPATAKVAATRKRTHAGHKFAVAKVEEHVVEEKSVVTGPAATGRIPLPATCHGTRAEVLHAIVCRLSDPDFIAAEKEANRVHLAYDDKGQPITSVVFDLNHPPAAGAKPGAHLVPIDEDDTIYVHMLAREDQLALYSITFDGSQEFALFRIHKPAANTITPFTRSFRDDNPDQQEPAYHVLTFAGGPFSADGNPAASIAVFIPQQDKAGAWTSVPAGAKRPLTIRKIYQFQVVLAIAGSHLDSGGFKAVDPDGAGPAQSFIFQEERETRTDFVLGLIPFVWRNGRDLSSPPGRFVERINPFVGFGFRKLLRSFYLGASLEAASGVHVIVGAQLERVDVLSPGFFEGQSPAPAVIPTVKEWDSRPFVGVAFPFDILNTIASPLFQ